jgi:hypothetical protein
VLAVRFSRLATKDRLDWSAHRFISVSPSASEAEFASEFEFKPSESESEFASALEEPRFESEF